MKTTLRRALAAACLAAIAAAAPAQEFTKENVQALYDRLAAATKAENVDQAVGFAHPTAFETIGATKQQVIEAVKLEFANHDYESYSSIVESVAPADDKHAIAHIRHQWKGTESGKPKEETKDVVVILKQGEGDGKILLEMDDVDPASVDRATSTYVSKTGGFSMQYPQGWIPTKAYGPLAAMLIDGVNVLSPDLGGSLFVGVVQLPMKMDPAAAAKMGAQADAAAAARLVPNFRMVSEGETALAGMPGWRIISEFDIAGEHRKRSQQYFGNDSLLYFAIGDIVGEHTPEREAAIRTAMGTTMESFKLRPMEEGVSVPEQVRADNAQGTIQGNVYTNRERKCFIAAPEGWAMRTSANPDTLVEMQKGSSIIRLLAHEGIPAGVSGEKIFSDRIASVRAITKDFVEKSRGEITLAGGPAWQSVQTYSLEGVGDFGVKEATVVRDGRYYLILCQSITPDKFADMEADFDKAIAGFGLLP